MAAPLPHRWTDEELARHRQIALQKFIKDRTRSPIPLYDRYFKACYEQIAALFSATDDLTRFDTGRLAQPQLLDAARYLAVPPWSEDDLATVSGVEFRRQKIPEDHISKLVATLQLAWDPHRFGWIKQARRPAPKERETAIRWTASVCAIERLRTHFRTERSKEQQRAVEGVVESAGFKRASLRHIPSPGDLPPMHFTSEAKLGPSKCDVAVRLPDGRILAIECKVSNSSINSYKRLIHEPGNKVRGWRDYFGRLVIPAVTLSGVYKLDDLHHAQEELGLAIFWAHDLKTLRAFLRHRWR